MFRVIQNTTNEFLRNYFILANFLLPYPLTHSLTHTHSLIHFFMVTIASQYGCPQRSWMLSHITSGFQHHVLMHPSPLQCFLLLNGIYLCVVMEFIEQVFGVSSNGVHWRFEGAWPFQCADWKKSSVATFSQEFF